MKKPGWVCRNAAQLRALEAWTLARLDELSEPTADDIRLEVEMMSDEKYMAMIQNDFAQRLKRGRLILARRAKDWKTVSRLADTEELRRLALRPRKRGRAKGESRPRDLPDFLKALLEYAAMDVEYIRAIWKRDFGKRNRSAAPTAIDIAARRNGVEENQLVNFKKNQHRTRK
jgi:hypothetical protein